MRRPDALPPAVTIIRPSQRRSSRAGRSVAAPPRARFSLRGLRKRPGRKTGLHPRRRLSAPPQLPRLLPCGQGVAACPPQAARRSDTERAVGEARSLARPPRGRPLHLDAGDKASQRARRTRASTWRLAPYEGGLERRAWERIRETPTVRVVSEPWNGWTSRTGPRSCAPQATGSRGPAQRCVEGAASGPAAIGVETAVSVDATLSLHLGRTVSGCHVFIVTSS